MHLDWAGSQNKPQQHESPLGSHVHHWLLHPHRQKDVLGDAGVWHEHDGEEEHWDDFISINCFADCVNSQPWGHVLESPNAYWQAQRHCWEVCMQVAVDEGMIKYFGPHTLKQFMQGKPTRFEYKIWILATSDSQLLACQQLFPGGQQLCKITRKGQQEISFGWEISVDVRPQIMTRSGRKGAGKNFLSVFRFLGVVWKESNFWGFWICLSLKYFILKFF